MMEKSNDEIVVPKFREIIANYSDEELRKVLKKRKLYQKEAADFAIEEAIKRGLIFTEQDLFSPEFQQEPGKFTLFPAIENEKARTKFIKSIARSLLILGALPLVMGGMKIFETQSLEGILIFLFGAVWGIVSFQFLRSVKMNQIILMYLLLAVAVGYVVKMFVSAGYAKITDVLFAAITLGLIAYGIEYLHKLKD